MLVPNRTSAAYDFELFETRADEKDKPAMGIKTSTGHSNSRSGSAFKILIVAVLAVMFPIYFLSSKVQSSELSGMISNVEQELAQARSDNARLQAELDSIVTTARVQEFAENELGMQKITTSQSVRISLGTGSTTEVAENFDNAVTYITEWFSDVLEYLGFK
ncbi:MAG: cell division protein FtsL [Oscillospiraceae bacterium]|nr:cell division protein FtsL [Oscillospiraceae bacterium]